MGSQAVFLARAALAGIAAGLLVYGAIGIGFGRKVGKGRRYAAVVAAAVCLGCLAAVWPFASR